MHRLRIRIKKYRYALEILEEMGRKDLRDRINAARKAQQELGRLHDLDVLIDLAGTSGSSAARAQLSRRMRAERAARLSRALAALAPLRARRSPGARPVAGSRR
jgi:CHAD domain-containing protein